MVRLSRVPGASPWPISSFPRPRLLPFRWLAVAAFPVRRVFCVGRNYAEHAREMGSDPDREPPFFFMKPADALLLNDADMPYPPQSRQLHHEMELVVALGEGGSNIAEADALRYVWGYAAGLDMTRRDLQNAAKKEGKPWDMGKGFDHSAPIGLMVPAGEDRPRQWADRAEGERQGHARPRTCRR